MPSDKPPTIREARKVLKSAAMTQRRTDRIFPAMLARSAVLLPYLSDKCPMTGDAIAWSRENKLPRAPPNKTMSYLESIGFANADL